MGLQSYNLLKDNRNPIVRASVGDSLKCYLEAVDPTTITESAGAVSQWDDKSRAGDDITQGTSAEQPTTDSVTINGLNAIDFDGTDDNMISSNLQNFLKPTDNFTVICTFKMDVNDANRKVLFGSSTDTNNRSTIAINTNNEIVSSIFDGSFTFKAAPLTNITNPHIVTFTNAAGTVNQYLDGLISTDVTGSPSTGASDLFRLGSRSDKTDHWNGPIGEFLVYNRVLLDIERLQIESFLANRRGISIQAPSNIDGFRLWLDSSVSGTITELSNLVSQWDDKSGSGNNSTQGTEAKQLTTNASTQNGLNILDADGSDTMELPSGLHTIPGGDNTLFVVSKTSLDTTRQRIIGMTESAGARYLLEYSAASGNMLWQSRNASGSGVTLTGVTKTNFNIFTCFRAGTTQSISVNGGTPVTNASGADEIGIDRADISGADGASLFLTGSIAAVLMYDRALSSTEITAVLNFLSPQWDITLT